MTNLRRTIQAMTLMILATASMGCSVIGFTAGAIKDGRQPDTIPRTTPEVLALTPGSPIEAVLSDGSTLTGTYSDLLAESGEPYGPAFARSRGSLLLDYPIPNLGSRVEINQKNVPDSYTKRDPDLWYTPTYTPPVGELLGMDQQGVLLKLDGSAKKFRWGELHSLGYREGTIEGTILAELTAAGRIPSVCGISLQDGDVHTPVFFSEVLEFRTRSSRNSKWVGLGVGLIADVVFVASAASSDWDLGEGWVGP